LVANEAIGTSGFVASGGGVHTEGTLTITRSTLTRNSARSGGAVVQRGGTFTTVNSTYSGNSGAFGGCINVFAGDCAISFCTIANNLSTFVGGLQVIPGGGSDVVDVTIKNSIVANNLNSNCDGPITTAGVNMSTDATCPGFVPVSTFDLNLQPLALNPPGTTETHAL